MASWHSPLFDWELIPLLRRRRYFAIRGIYAGILLVILWSMFEVTMDEFRSRGGMRTSNAATFAHRFFVAFMFAQMTAILVATPSYVAATIAVHRERRNLDDLRTTDVSDFEIVLEKTIASWRTLRWLPVMMVPIWAAAIPICGLSIVALPCILFVTLCHLTFTAGLSIRIGLSSATVAGAIASTLSALFIFEVVVPLLFAATWHPNTFELPMLITPWVSWYVVHFAGGASLDRILIALLSACIYGLVGLALARASIRGFDRFVGRTVQA